MGREKRGQERKENIEKNEFMLWEGGRRRRVEGGIREGGRRGMGRNGERKTKKRNRYMQGKGRKCEGDVVEVEVDFGNMFINTGVILELVSWRNLETKALSSLH
jgi:hypothetical protein